MDRIYVALLVLSSLQIWACASGSIGTSIDVKTSPDSGNIQQIADAAYDLGPAPDSSAEKTELSDGGDPASEDGKVAANPDVGSGVADVNLKDAQTGDSSTQEMSISELEDGTFVCRPAGAGPFPGVLYNHGGKGNAVGGDLEGTCEALAELGFLARSERRPPSMTLFGQFDDVLLGFDALAAHPDVDTEKIGIMGFSRGGFLALQFAITRPDEIHAMILMAPAPGGLDPATGAPKLNTLLNDAALVQAPTRVMISENDEILSLAEDTAEALAAAGKDAELITYPPFTEGPNQSGHDLFFEVREPYWSDVAAFLQAALLPD